MRVPVYKRTHPDDPDTNGCFGAQDCMGMIRARRFDAVIGVGGLGQEPRSHQIAGKINWIGIGTRRGEWFRRGPLVTLRSSATSAPKERVSAREHSIWQAACTAAACET